MARKISITKQMIQDTAFQVLKEEGTDGITARKLSAKIGCSTQPLFRVYDGMEELNSELFLHAMEYFDSFYLRYPKNSNKPFVDLGMAYISFAEKEPNLFRLLFLTKEREGKQLYELLNGKTEAVKTELMKAATEGCKNPGELFTKMWIFIHGTACMTITDDFDLNPDETRALLIAICDSFKNN